METTSGAVLRCVVGTSEAKGLLYSRLQLSGEDGLPRHEGPGVIHFPMTVGDAFFTELTAEHMVTRAKRGGFAEAVWEMRPGVRRNEALDCYVMALAALRVVCPNAARFADLAARVAATRAAEARPVAPAARPSAGPLDARAAARPRTVRWPGKAGGNELY
jgi:phage terminase large subunit GpA-like protein